MTSRFAAWAWAADESSVQKGVGMTFSMKPLVSRYENNYGGAVKRLKR